jgi:hypothetical protein
MLEDELAFATTFQSSALTAIQFLSTPKSVALMLSFTELGEVWLV